MPAKENRGRLHPFIRVAPGASLGRLCRDFCNRGSGYRAVFLGALWTVIAALALGFGKFADAGARMIVWLLLVVGVCVLLAPLFWAIRTYVVIRRGRLVIARVTSISDRPTGRVTLDGRANGWVEGSRSVQSHPPFEDDFVTDAPWAPELQPGGLMQVVVDEHRRRVLLEAGLMQSMVG